jgi:hypothetical protein
MYFQVKNTLENNIYYYLKQTLILLAQYILCFNLKPRSVSDSSKYHVFQVPHDVGSGLTTPIIIVIYIYIKKRAVSKKKQHYKQLIAAQRIHETSWFGCQV